MLIPLRGTAPHGVWQRFADAKKNWQLLLRREHCAFSQHTGAPVKMNPSLKSMTLGAVHVLPNAPDVGGAGGEQPQGVT